MFTDILATIATHKSIDHIDIWVDKSNDAKTILVYEEFSVIPTFSYLIGEWNELLVETDYHNGLYDVYIPSGTISNHSFITSINEYFCEFTNKEKYMVDDVFEFQDLKDVFLFLSDVSNDEYICKLDIYDELYEVTPMYIHFPNKLEFELTL